MAKLVDVYRNGTLSRRQLPLVIDDNLTMVMDMSSMGLVCDRAHIRGKELEEFHSKLLLLTMAELKTALMVSIVDIHNVLDQVVPCVGCRRSVERLYYQLMESRHLTLDPVIIDEDGLLTIKEDKITSSLLCSLFHGHRNRLNHLVDSLPRSKKSRRCLLHSLDSQRQRPVTAAWREVWEVMRPQCKDEVVLIESSTLHATLETYLRKHRFCGECRTKVLRAYILLVEEPDPCKEKGYVPALYSGIKRCISYKHIHLQTKTEYIANLIMRAEPEIMGSRRERHAKTLEIAQEEVLTCLGICVYERLYKIYMRLREEECTCQVLAAVAVECLCRSFETAVEVKRGVSQLELLYEELAKEEQLKIHRKEQKKLKRKRKKERKAELDEKENCEECFTEIVEPLDTCLCSSVKTNDSDSCVNCDKGSKHVKTFVCQDKEKLINKCNRPNKTCVNKLLDTCTTRALAEEKCNNNIDTKPDVSLSPCQSCQFEKDDMSDLITIKSNKKDTLRFNGGWSSSEHSQDYGYSSENNNGCCDTASGSSSLNSSPEGSDVACSEGFCNHETDCHLERPHSGFNDYVFGSTGALSLQQMLDSSSDEDEEKCYIPVEEVLEFKSKEQQLTEKRQELRENLKTKFAQLCIRVPRSHPRLVLPAKIAAE